MTMTPDSIAQSIEATGLAARGAVRLEAEERVGPLEGIDHLVLVGIVGRRGWDAFTHSAEAADGLDHPLNRWSERLLGALAERCGATPIFPFGGPPHWPFQRWAQRAEPLHPSPLGLLIHPEYGLWHSYRGALTFAHRLEVEAPIRAPSPCEACTARPCLTACPVGAFTAAGYDVDACAGWLRGEAGAGCMTNGCQARRACPVGRDFAHAPDQASFGMRAFLAALSASNPPAG